MTRLPLWGVILSGALIAAFWGCRSMAPAVTWYTLRPLSGIGADADAGAGSSLTIGIRPVTLPGYLRRTQMVTRDGPYRLAVSSLHRWANYPDRLVQQLIGENLQALMPRIRIVNPPWPVGLQPDLSLAFDFLELIGTDEKKMLLSVEWRVGETQSADGVQRTTLVEPIAGSGYDELAAAHSRVLEALCREVAQTLDTLYR
ncbi:MAG: PqiC family protein [Desulfosarcina sp.]